MCQPPSQGIRKVLIASLLGSTIEWYDFFLYGVVAGIVFNKLYFPTTDPFMGTILAYSTFAIGYLARPFGGFVFGHFGDKMGRKSMLILTMLIMGIGTMGIGLVPTYATIGIAALIILQTFRLAQGLGLGGEWGGAVLMTYEYARPKEKAFYASIPQMGLATGLCFASGMVALLSYTLTDEQFLAWGWRVAFLISFVLVIVALYVRMHILETPEFRKVEEQRMTPPPTSSSFSAIGPITATFALITFCVTGILLSVCPSTSFPAITTIPSKKGQRHFIFSPFL
jgi:MFS family permease